MKTVKIGTRDSKLALAQTQIVKDAIIAYDSTINVEIVALKTTGDKILDVTLDKIGGKGLFVKELSEALNNNMVDIAVHSYKDVPMEIDENLPIVATSRREDVRDTVLMRKGESLTINSVLGCSSKRRTVQLNEMGYNNIVFLRGNVQTRLKKCEDGICDGAVLAAAGIKRLNMEDKITRYFDVAEILPAPCQGVIAVQARRGEDVSYLNDFNDNISFNICLAERSFARALGGGCSSPVAAYGTVSADEIFLQGMYVDDNGKIKRANISGKLSGAQELGTTLAEQIKEKV